jgi:hypothetical protein
MPMLQGAGRRVVALEQKHAWGGLLKQCLQLAAVAACDVPFSEKTCSDSSFAALLVQCHDRADDVHRSSLSVLSGERIVLSVAIALTWCI